MAATADEPVNLHPLQGRETLRASLIQAHLRGELPSPLLLHGAAGVGKQRLGHWIGQLLLCEQVGKEGPCGACKGCRLHLRLEHPDFHWYMPLPRPSAGGGPERLAETLEEARWERIEEIREKPLRPSIREGTEGLHLATARNLRRRSQQRPSVGRRQVFLVAEAELLVAQEASPEAANALLKTLEEPPRGTTFLLTSNEPGRLLPTIRSRSVHLHVPPLAQDRVEAFLTSVAGVGAEEAARAASLAQGSVGRALGFVRGPGGEDAPLDTLRRRAYRMVRAAVAPRAGERFLLPLDFPVSGGRGLGETLSFVESWLRDLAAVPEAGPTAAINVDSTEALQELAGRSGVRPDRIPAALAAVQEARRLASGNVNPQLLVYGLVHDLASALGTGDEPAAEEPA